MEASEEVSMEPKEEEEKDMSDEDYRNEFDPNEYQFKYYDRFDTYKGLFNTQHFFYQDDFRLFFSNNICYVYDAYINQIQIMKLNKNKLELIVNTISFFD